MKERINDAEKNIAAYFESRKIILRDKKGEPVVNESGEFEYTEKPSTITGLALALGFSSREELYEVKDKKTKKLIDRALLMIEEKAEEKLFDKESFNGTKLFLATNFARWSDAAINENDDNSGDMGVFSTWAK